jgi:hypothetical protein
MCSLKEVVSLLLVHFDLPLPSVRVCLSDHSLCLSKFRLVDFQEADIRAKVSAVQASVRMRTWTGDNRYGAVTICERLSENVSGEAEKILTSGVMSPFTGLSGTDTTNESENPTNRGCKCSPPFSADPSLKGFEISPKRVAKANYKSSRILQYFLNCGVLIRRFRQPQSLELLALALNVEEDREVVAQLIMLVFHGFLPK